MRDTTKNIEIEIDGEKKTFIIQKMDAFTGAFLMKLLTEKVLPSIKSAFDVVNSENPEDEKAGEISMSKFLLEILPNLLSSLDEAETKRLMTICLQTVSCVYQAGLQKVLDSNGNFGVPELEYDIAICLKLVYEVFAFNCAGFFEESGLSSILGRLNGSRPTQ